MKIRDIVFHFCLFVPFLDGYILYNTLNGALLFRNKDLKGAIEYHQEEIPPNMLNELEKQGVLVDESVEKLSVYEYQFNKIRSGVGCAWLAYRYAEKLRQECRIKLR